MLDYKSIIIKRYALGMSYKELAEEFSASKSGTNNRSADYEQPISPKCISRWRSAKYDARLPVWKVPEGL